MLLFPNAVLKRCQLPRSSTDTFYLPVTQRSETTDLKSPAPGIQKFNEQFFADLAQDEDEEEDEADGWKSAD